MNRKLCIIHANCQGEELEQLLSRSKEFVREFRVLRYTNYTREEVPAEALTACSLFLYQHLGAEWGDIASSCLLAKLPSSASSLQIPNMYCNLYWPFWRYKGGSEYSDSFLDRLIAEDTPKSVMMTLYLKKDIIRYVDMHALREQYFAYERGKEGRGPLRYVDYIEERFTARPLFYTVNHPGAELLLLTANALLQHIGMHALSSQDCASMLQGHFPSYNDFFLPIHPQVAAYHKLAFGEASDKFNIYGRKLSFAEYISRYIDCHQNGCGDIFTGYLHLV